MRAGADEVYCLFVDAVDQYPIRLDMTVTKALPLAGECMITMSVFKGLPDANGIDDGPQ